MTKGGCSVLDGLTQCFTVGCDGVHQEMRNMQSASCSSHGVGLFPSLEIHRSRKQSPSCHIFCMCMCTEMVEGKSYS